MCGERSADGQLPHRSACRAVELTKKLKAQHGPKLKDFKAALESTVPPELEELRSEVETFAMRFPTIGFERANMRYKD